MYEVDGVFKPSDGEAIDEERTQVVRIMFLPQNLDKKLEELNVVFGTEEHRLLLEAVGGFLRSAKRDQTMPPGTGKKEQILQFILNWYLSVGFFLIGYIVFEICSQIEMSGDKKETAYEKEVWLTSFWHFNVNRFEFTGTIKNPTSFEV